MTRGHRDQPICDTASNQSGQHPLDEHARALGGTLWPETAKKMAATVLRVELTRTPTRQEIEAAEMAFANACWVLRRAHAIPEALKAAMAARLRALELEK